MRDSITDGASSVRKYKYLVQRIKYPVDTIPTFVCMSDIFTNMCLFIILVLLYIAFGFMPTIYYLQIPLFYLMAFVFFVLWGLFSSMLAAVSKDFLNLVRATVTALFWLSGIVYNVDNIESETIKSVMMFNPITIIVNGFRNSLIYHKWFWETPEQMRNYLIVTAVMFVLAIWSYKKLNKEIPDVL